MKVGSVGDGEEICREKSEVESCPENILDEGVDVGMNEEADALSDLDGEKSEGPGEGSLTVTFAYDLGVGVDGAGSESTECSESVRSKNSDEVGDRRSG